MNFISHVRGSSRSQEEELLRTEGGSKITISHGNAGRKIDPEKLSQGLFLGANARILSRIIPNITPDIVVYLDYLRIIGDLLINYTPQSVYVLDHEHRFEVVELNHQWNQIDPMLSLNVLKRRDASSITSPVVSTKSSNSNANSAKSSKSDSKAKSDSTSYGETPLCWQWNQPDGCKHAKCRYVHKCSVAGCGAAHPAWKHNFRSQSSSQSA